MIKINEAIAVEGNYDKIKLSQLVDTTIVVLDGFMIYKDKPKQNMLKMLADKCGLIILTDSDAAGFRIRTYLKNVLAGKNVKHAYIPDIKGKEKRKAKPSKEGFLGVEGMSDEIILKALSEVSSAAQNGAVSGKTAKRVTKADLFADGFSGGENSHDARRRLTKVLGLPSRISANMLLDVINSLYTYDEYKMIADAVKGK